MAKRDVKKYSSTFSFVAVDMEAAKVKTDSVLAIVQRALAREVAKAGISSDHSTEGEAA